MLVDWGRAKEKEKDEESAALKLAAVGRREPVRQFFCNGTFGLAGKTSRTWWSGPENGIWRPRRRCTRTRTAACPRWSPIRTITRVGCTRTWRSCTRTSHSTCRRTCTPYVCRNRASSSITTGASRVAGARPCPSTTTRYTRKINRDRLVSGGHLDGGRLEGFSQCC